MEEITHLVLTGFSGFPIPNTFFRPDAQRPTQRLALVFPGRGYTCAMPLLYYPTRLFVQNNIDTLWVETNYSSQPRFDTLTNQEQLAWISADASAATHAALTHGNYYEIILIGKSLGTLALAHLVVNEPALTHASVIWLTPLVRNPFIQTAAAQTKPRSLIILGDADPLYTPDGLARMAQSTQGQVLLIPNANHSLEIPDDLPASLQAMQQALAVIQTFCGL